MFACISPEDDIAQLIEELGDIWDVVGDISDPVAAEEPEPTELQRTALYH